MICILSLNPSIDKFISVDNLACGRTNYANSVKVHAGGKGINSIIAASKLGAQAELIGFCANKPGIIEQALDNENIRYRLIPAFDEIRENIKITDDFSRQITEINQKGKINNSSAISSIISLCIEAAKKSSFLIMTGSVPDGCPESVYRDIIESVKSKNNSCKCIVDSSNASLKFSLDSNPYIIKPNLQELEQLVQKELNQMEDIKHAALSVVESGVEIVLVSMGRSGALLVTAGSSYYAPALLCNPVCEVGAGDCMLAAMVAELDAGNNLLQAFRCSIAASAASVSSNDGGLSDMDLYKKFKNQVTIEQR